MCWFEICCWTCAQTTFLVGRHEADCCMHTCTTCTARSVALLEHLSAGSARELIVAVVPELEVGSRVHKKGANCASDVNQKALPSTQLVPHVVSHVT